MAKLEASAAIVLAAGLSRRYGPASKLNADLRGRPLAHHIIETVAALPFGARIAVCRFGDEDLARAFAQHGFDVVINTDSARGLSSSLALGVEAVGGQAEAVLVCLADMPNVSSRHLLALIEKVAAPGDIVASVGESDTPTPPAAFGRGNFPALLALDGDKGARDLLGGAIRVRASAVELADFDTPADFSGAS